MPRVILLKDGSLFTPFELKDLQDAVSDAVSDAVCAALSGAFPGKTIIHISLLQQFYTEKRQSLWTTPIISRNIKKVNT